MKVQLHILLFVSLSCWQTAFAAEVDSVTPRGRMLADVRSDLNTLFNQRIREGVKRANAQQETGPGNEYGGTTKHSACDEETLYTELRKALFQSFTASWGLKGYALDTQLRELLAGKSIALPLEDSIYRDIDYLEGASLNLKGLSHLVNLNGHLIGLDKLGHFFAEGWQYFEISNEETQSLTHALAWGKQKEAGLFGSTTTGVFSFADLATNLDGWRFWNKVLLKKKDPLKNALGNLVNRPYISCDLQILDSIWQLRLVRAWEINTRFDISDYANAAWDEGINCNHYATPAIEAKVQARIHEIAPNFSCPISIQACQQARSRYRVYANEVLHPRCFTGRASP